MLVRLIYTSRSLKPIDDALTKSILELSIEHNSKMGITGVLCMHKQGQIFLQVLEGGRSAINVLYNQIVRDERHQDVMLLDYAEIDERRFSGWRMGCVDLNKINVSTLLKYSEKPQLDPYSMTSHGALELVEELIDTAAIVGME